jgi:AAA domain
MRENYNASSLAVSAVYTEQRIPRFKNNPLIAALPPALAQNELVEYLHRLPDFEEEQRDWPDFERLHCIAGLSAFLTPLERHLKLAWALDTMLRQGYVGRAPRTVEHVKIFQKLYEAQQAGKAFTADTTPIQLTSQISSSLVGPSGQGKTTAVKCILARYPQVIYHEDLDTLQIPYIHIEAPHDGISVKGLAHSILRKIDELILDGRYVELYGNYRNSAVTLLNHVARVMHMHSVGLLVVDEIQNIRNAGNDTKTLMAYLVSASNELGVPIAFIGTNRATKILGLDFSQGRRSVGHGMPAWGALASSEDLHAPDEWEDFVATLWRFQWVKNFTPLTQGLSKVLFFYCQGIIDIAIKIFACAQWQAIFNGSEVLSAQTLDDVWERDFKLLHRMMNAYRSGDMTSVETYSDIAPVKFNELFDNVLNRYDGARAAATSARPGDDDFSPTIASALVLAGVSEERAVRIADSVEAKGNVSNVQQGLEDALKMIKPVRASKGKTKADTSDSISLAPDDYRNAVFRAQEEGNGVLEHLRAMGALSDIDRIFELG